VSAICDKCDGTGMVWWMRPGNRPTSHPCPKCQPAAWPIPAIAQNSAEDGRSANWWKGYAEGKQDVIDRLNRICSAKDAEIAALKKSSDLMSNALAAIVNRSYASEFGRSTLLDMRQIACSALDGTFSIAPPPPCDVEGA